MKEIVEYIVKSLVEHPDEVEISVGEDQTAQIIYINVLPDDMGKVIGKNGKIAQSIRTIVKSLSSKQGKKCVVKINERND